MVSKKRKVTKNRNIFVSTFKYMMVFFRIFGLNSIKLSKNESHFEASFWWSLYIVILYISLFILYINCILFEYLLLPMTSVNIVMYVGASVPIFSTLTLAFISSIKNKQKTAEILNKLIYIQQIFENSGIKTSYKSLKIRTILYAIFALYLLVHRGLMGVYLFGFSICAITDAYWQDVYRILVIENFISYLLFINQKYTEINRYLNEFKAHVQRWPFCQLNKMAVKQLSAVFDVYFDLIPLSKDLNAIFDFQILFYMISNFIEITFLIYISYEYFNGIEFYHSSVAMWVVTLIWPVGCFFVIGKAISACVSIYKQVRNIKGHSKSTQTN